jgi:hypothetical protein
VSWPSGCRGSYPEILALLLDVELTGNLPPVVPDGLSGYTHRDLVEEIEEAYLALEDLVGVEGMPLPAKDMQTRLIDPAGWQVVLNTARALERVPEPLGLGPTSGRHRPPITQLVVGLIVRIGWWLVVLFGLQMIALLLGLIFRGSLHGANLGPALIKQLGSIVLAVAVMNLWKETVWAVSTSPTSICVTSYLCYIACFGCTKGACRSLPNPLGGPFNFVVATV